MKGRRVSQTETLRYLLPAMDDRSLKALTENVDRLVRITVVDGEVLTAKVLSVSEEDQDVVYDLLGTDRPEKYEKHDVQPAYCLEFRHIASVVPAPTERA
jgi:hypothetical protein